MPTYTSDYILSHKEDLDLYTILRAQKLPEKTLEKLVFWVNLNTLLITQDLSIEFVVRYFMDAKYQQEDNETTISYKDIEHHQGYSRKQIEEYIKQNGLVS